MQGTYRHSQIQERSYMVSANGQHLAVLAFNEDKKGTPLIFIHGIVASVNFWHRGMTEVIKDNYRWYSLSLPGHYPSSFPENMKKEDINEDMFFQAVDTAISSLRITGPVIIGGHSLGGFAALNYAVRRPEMVKGVISIGGFSIGRWQGLEGFLQRMARKGKPGELFTKASLKSVFSNKKLFSFIIGFAAANKQAFYAYPHFDEVIDMVYPDVKNHNPNSIYYLFNRVPEFNITDLLPRITAPTLVIAGDKDPVIPFEHTKYFSSQIPNTRLEVFRNVGHMPFAEDSDKYHKVITEWLGEIDL